MSDGGFECLTNLRFVALSLTLSHGREDQVAENQRDAGLEIGWQVNQRIFGLDSSIPSPRGRGNQVAENQRVQDWESDGR